MARAASIVSIVGMQAQFVSLMTKLSLPWPNEWLQFLSVLELLNLDPRDILGTADLPIVDFRVLFIFVANILPIVITILVLVLFQPVSTVAWYATTAASFVMMITGIVIRFMEGLTIGIWFAAGGGFIFAFCLMMGIVAYMYHHVDDDKLNRYASAIKLKIKQREEKSDALKPDVFRTLRCFAIFLICLIMGCVLNGFFITHVHANSKEKGTLQAIGYTLFVVGAIAMLYFINLLSFEGRLRIFKLHHVLSANLLMVMLVLLSCVYVPVVTYCVNVFMCAKYECPAATQFNPSADRPDESYSRSSDLFCDPCVFLDQRCMAVNGTAPQSPTAWCPAFETNRVWKSPEVRCNDEATTFFYISSILVMPIFIVLLPLMYYHLISKITTIVNDEVALVPEDGENLDHVAPVNLYERRVYACEPAAASLYQPFRWHMRQYSIVMLFFRLVVVVVTNIISPWASDVAIFVLMGVNIVATGALLFQKPFISFTEYYLSLCCTVVSVVNTVYAALLYYDAGVPDWVAYIVIAINILFPVLLCVYTLRFMRGSHNNKESRKGQKMLERVRTVENLKKKRAAKKKPKAGDDFSAVLLAPDSDDDGSDNEEMMSMKSFADVGAADDDDLSVQESFEDMRKRTTLSRHASGPVLDINRAERQKRTAREMEVILTIANERNEEVTRNINTRTSSIMTKFFMVVGFILLLAFGSSILGYLKSEPKSIVDGTSAFQRSNEIVLGKYTSWQNFTDHCCCIESRHPPVQYKVMERWICENGMTVDRGRMSRDGSNSGLSLRELCSRTFNPLYDCQVGVDLKDGEVSFKCWNVTMMTQNPVTEKAMELFW